MDFEIRRSRWKALALVAISAGLAGGGVCGLKKDPCIAWGVIAFFGACGLVGVWMFLDSRPVLVLNDSGIYSRPMGVGTILWEDIESVYEHGVRDERFLCFRLYNPEEYHRRMSRFRQSMSSLNESLGFTDFSIHLGLLDQSADEVKEFIAKKIESTKRDQPQDDRIRATPPPPGSPG